MSEEEFLKTKNGRSILENILVNRMKEIPWPIFEREESLRLILKYKRYDLLKYVSANNLFREFNNKTYLDFIVEELFKNSEYSYLVLDPFDSEICKNLDQVARMYLIYAKYDCQRFLPPLDEDRLLSKDKINKFIGSRSLLDILLKKDRELTTTKLVPFGIQEKFSVAANLVKNNVEVKRVSFDEIKEESLAEKYLKKESAKYDEWYKKLTIEDRTLIGKVCDKLIMNGSGKDAITVFKNSYTMQLFNGIASSRTELRKLSELLDQDKTFKIVKGEDCCFSPGDNTIYINNQVISSFNHELAHAFFHKIANEVIEDKFYHLVNNIREDKEVLKKSKALIDELRKIKFQIKEESKTESNKTFDKTEENLKKAADLVKSSKEEFIEEYVNKGYDRKVVEKLIEQSFTPEELIRQFKESRITTLASVRFRSEHAVLLGTVDILDAIYGGALYDGLLKDDNKTIRSNFGHGVWYYNKDNNSVFNEIIANYLMIRKSTDKNCLRTLVEYTSMDFVRYLENYYNDYIVKGKIQQLDNRFSRGA